MNGKLYVAAIFLLTLGIVLGAKAHSETIIVKYRGPVSLENFSCSYSSSSFVHRICYRSNREYLVVLLNQTYYHYCRVQQSVVDSWLSAGSKGKFYNAYIKGNYDCRLGGIPTG